MRQHPLVPVGIVLSEAYFGVEEWRNAQRAEAYVEEAAGAGAKLILLPEGYPGPATGPVRNPYLKYRPMEALQGLAKKHRVYIFAGDVEESDRPGAYRLTLKAIGPTGEILAKYMRVQPDTPPLNAYLYDGKAHLLPGERFIVLETEYGNLGLLICSELYVPELARVLMLRGAEIILCPVHGNHSQIGQSNANTWHCIARARAAENLCYVLGTRNLFIHKGFDARSSEHMGAYVAGPEEMVALRQEPGVLIASLDMERLDFLRSRNYDEQSLSRPRPGWRTIRCRPGQIWERDPQLYEDLVKPHRFSFDYRYYERGLDAWKAEYERIYGGEYRKFQEEYGELEFRE